MATNYSTPSTAADRTTIYQKFKGADFSTDSAAIDASRSPWPLNLIADDGGFPEKRPGWETVKSFDGRVNGVFAINLAGSVHFVIHHGTKVSKMTAAGEGFDAVTFDIDVTDARSVGFVQGGRLYILTGGEFIVYDGESAMDAADTAYVPTTVISRDPAGGGTTFEAVNLLSKWRTNEFLADGTSKAYQLDGAPIDADALRVIVNDKEMTEGTDFTVNRETGTVTFSTAPAKPESAGGIAGADNVMITFARTVSGYADRIRKCTVCTQYGRGTTDRVFFSGNPNFPNYDWCSGFRDPTYVPDTSYALIGSEETAVMGYLPFGDALAVIKEDNQQDATVFIRTTELASTGETTFPIIQGAQSVGAVSKYCFANLRDDPLFLSESGVNAITTNAVTYEKAVRRRSAFIDAKLTKEEGLSEAVAAVWNAWYVVAVNGVCYVADSRQKSYQQQLADNFLYEWYYWDHVPARVLFEHDGVLWFGTADGRLCRFKQGAEMSVFSDDGEPIVAEWTTKADSDGDFMRFKTMIRRGSGVMLKPYTQSAVKILVRTQDDFGKTIREVVNGIFDWNDIDFANFTFNTIDTPRIVPFNKKIRKYKTLQIIVRSEGVNQGFGVFSIIKRFRMGGYVKR